MCPRSVMYVGMSWDVFSAKTINFALLCGFEVFCLVLFVCFLFYLREIQSMGKSWCWCYVPNFHLAGQSRQGRSKPGHSRIPALPFSFHKLLLSCWSCQQHRKTFPLGGLIVQIFPHCVTSFGMGLDPWRNPKCNWILLQNPFGRKPFVEEPCYSLVVNILSSICTLCFSFLIWLQKCIP